MPLHGENKAYPAYTQLRQVTGGANGLIHLARHTGWDMPCVQKTYDRPGRDDAVAFAEPRLLRELDHPHIVKIIDAQPDGDRPHAVTMVMPEYPGGNLHDALARGAQFSVGEVIELVAQIAGALDYLHTNHRLLHRDVKPKNLLLDTQHNLVLCDFGSAARMSVTGHTAGVRATVPYQPPETAGKNWMRAESDIYSLGLTAIEMLDGRFLWTNVDVAVLTSRVDRGKRGYSATVLGPAARPPHTPAALRSLVGRCVATEPDARPTAAQLVRQLQALNVVDWKHVHGSDLEGRWVGSWPPRARTDRAVMLEATSEVVPRGRNTGKRRLTCRYRTTRSGAWRTIGGDVSPAYLDAAHNSAEVSRFFRTVSERVAQRFPA